MAQDNDPTKKFLDATEKFQERLHKLWKVVFKKVSTYMKSMVAFTRQVAMAAKELAATVGKSVIDKVVNAAQMVERIISNVPALVKRAIMMGKKIIALIKKATDPNAIIATLKKLFRRYMMMFQQIFDFVTNLIAQLDILGAVFGVVATFKNVLRLLFSWITDVTRANDMALKSKRLLKKVWKEMKKEVKEAKLLRKEVMKLKVAA